MKYFPITLENSIIETHTNRDYDKFIIACYDYICRYYKLKANLGIMDSMDMAGEFMVSGKLDKIYNKEQTEKFSGKSIIKYLYTSLGYYYIDLATQTNKNRVKTLNIPIASKSTYQHDINGMDLYYGFVDTLNSEENKHFAMCMLDYEMYDEMVENKYMKAMDENDPKMKSTLRVKEFRLKDKYKKFFKI